MTSRRPILNRGLGWRLRARQIVVPGIIWILDRGNTSDTTIALIVALQKGENDRSRKRWVSSR